jgi:adenylate kinase family enzyme
MPIQAPDAVDPARLARTVVIGTSCAGKSTLGRALGERLGSPWCDLDDLHWLPGWIERDLNDFRQRVSTVASGERWVVSGNYLKASDLLWTRATALVVLDYSFETVVRRALARTLHRVLNGAVVCNGNRETLAQACSRDGVLWWVLTTWRPRHLEYVAMLERDERDWLALVRLRGQDDAERLLARAGQ